VTKQDILNEVERQMGLLDEEAKRAVSAALDLVLPTAPPPGAPAPSQPALAWQGENPPFEEMAKLDVDERSRIIQELEDRNLAWLQARCEELKAGWLLVIDGQVLRCGSTLVNYLQEAELDALSQQTGKFPLIYVHPRLLGIEEITSWHATSYPGDFYPTIRTVFERGTDAIL